MSRYFRRGTTKIYFVSTIADIDAPTEAEMAAGTDITCDVAEISGFSFSNSPIDVPDMCSPFVKSIPGEDTAEDSSITFYEDNTSNPTRTLLLKGVEGYMALFPYGVTGGAPSAGDELEVWPVSVASSTREWSAGNEPARFMVEFTITDVPDQDAVVVA